MDSRIGQLNSGKFYAYTSGLNNEPTIGSLAEVEIALGLRKSAKKARKYIVTVTPKQEFHFNHAEEIEVDAVDANDAVKQVRARCSTSRFDVANTYIARLA